MDPFDWLVLTCSYIFVSVYGVRKLKSSQENSRDLFIGSNTSVWAVALSVCSGFVSSISLIGFPAEVYYYGGIVLWLIASYYVAFPIVAFIFLPVFYRLKLQSIYEYMELRFCRCCRILGLTMFFIQTVLYTSIVLFTPSLAMSSITGVSLPTSILFTALLGAIYISIGGARAGVHTSAIQMILIFLGLFAIAAVNCYENSFVEAVKTAYSGYRLNVLDFRINPTIRHSFWTLFLGGIGNTCLFAANQFSVQRYISLPSLKQAQWVVLLNIPCNTVICICYVLLGILIYNKYHSCDPAVANINETASAICLALLDSSLLLYTALLLASFTAISTVLMTEISQLYVIMQGQPFEERTAFLLARIMPFIVAISISSLAWLCQFLESLALQIAFSVFGAIGGPVLGTYIVGFFIPYAKGRSGVAGLLLSLIACFSIALGAIYYEVRPVRCPLSYECNQTTEKMLPSFNIENFGRVRARDGWFSLASRISYQYYSLVGIVVNVLAACIFQFAFGEKDGAAIPDELLSPLVTRSQHSVKVDKTVENSLL